jgi:hypothetical protein
VVEEEKEAAAEEVEEKEMETAVAAAAANAVANNFIQNFTYLSKDLYIFILLKFKTINL